MIPKSKPVVDEEEDFEDELDKVAGVKDAELDEEEDEEEDEYDKPNDDENEEDED